MTAPIDWRRFRKCPVCHALIGEACRSLSGTVMNGRPDAVVTVLDRPHSSRKPKKGAVT